MDSTDAQLKIDELISTEETIKLHAEISRKINFAGHQNDFPLVQDLRIENLQKDKRLENVIITMTSNPAFLKPRSWEISRIEPESVMTIPAFDRQVILNGQFLLNLSEMIRGEVTFTVSIADEVITKKDISNLQLLAYNEWGGTDYMPEMLAAFVVPNDPSIDRIINSASLVLRKAGKDDRMNGYSSKSRERVWEMVSAIYTAVANLGITYANPPASYEKNGQKIRLPGQILSNKVATCLDTTMLLASAFEQIGLNPIIVLPEGHAMVGVWLQPDSLGSIVIDDAEVIRKRIQLKELVLFETTYLTSNPTPSFSKAVAEAVRILIPENDAKFHAAVDIRRARGHQITPLALKQEPDLQIEAPEAEVQLGFEAAPVLPDFTIEDDETEVETPTQRVDRWQRKLLDLTARNPLLSFKDSKASLRIVCPDPAILEDKLADGEKLSLQVPPSRLRQKQDESLHNARTGEIISEQFARSALENKQILVDMTEDELGKRAVEIYRKAQTSFQEGGANTLFLALGFLRWKRDERNDKAFKAPLILLPVTLERKSVRSGFKLSANDEEPRFNTTLLEMLRKDFDINISGLDGELPHDKSGVDVNGIWNTIRKKVKDAKGFEVVEDVALGHFSFTKYLMWKDLVDRADQLRENPVVKHLMDTPRDAYSSDVSFVDKSEIDKTYSPSDLLAPLPADSSQMAVIATADKGKDFVVIGPPGTGKSQTIGNLIAHFLGKGKTVLFVSEKTAALDVVYRRLEQLGLNRFCLALHSNKARKTEVLEQLRSSWGPMMTGSKTDWEKEAERLKKLRDRLNLVVDRLHIPRRNGMTAHYAMGVKIRDEALATKVKLSWVNSEAHDESQLELLREVVDKLRVQAESIGDLNNNPLHLVETANWSPQWEAEITAMAGDLITRVTETKIALRHLLETLKLNLPDTSKQRLNGLEKLARVMQKAYRGDAGFALLSDGSDYIEGLEKAVNHLRRFADSQSLLSCSYQKDAWRQIDGEEIEQDWNYAIEQWWPKSLILKRRVIKKLKRNGAKGKPNPYQDAAILTQMRTEGSAIEKLDKQLNSLKLWQGLETNPDEAIALKDLGVETRSAVGMLTDDINDLAQLRIDVRTLMTETNDFLAPDAPIGRACHDFLSTYSQFKTLLDDFQQKTGSDANIVFSKSVDLLSDIENEAVNLQLRRQELRNWCTWRMRRNEAIELGLKPLVDAIDHSEISPNEINQAFEAGYCAWWSGALIGEDDILREFSSAEHDADIQHFRAIDESFQNLTAKYIEAKLAGNLPGSENVTKNSDWGLLRRELQKKSRHKSVRTLIEEIPSVLNTLAPCMMMSPLSVAQYLPTDQDLFDVVIFDEASQITVWDAVGAIARGKQVIVAGDPKQMPPTSFFARKDEDPDGDAEYEPDLESILDEMLGASIPKLTLNLHYRSRREGLIAFSNHNYYDNSLITFPAPLNPDRSVTLASPEGTYARGGARHNEGEAKAVVAEIIKRLTSEDKKVQEQSIGVVTFNTEQQSLIENLLDKERANYPELERFFSNETMIEPVFVKNLETVQGDERDIILFSVTYGRDISGHITMNFGPLNREGGERRLNVALTRARNEMKVFSTLNHEDINLNSTKSRGVRDLKHFLQYAHRGPSELGAAIHGSLGDFESPFESAVAIALREKGWEIHPQIGVSAFRIDLGIVHPDIPGVYLAGIECDGAMYHSSAFARERDKIRQSVLEGLGWTLIRIWSTDWWTHKHAAINLVHESLLSLVEKDKIERDTEVIPSTHANPKELEEDDSKGLVEPQLYDEPTPDNISDHQLISEIIPVADINSIYIYRVTDFKSVQFSVSSSAFYSEPYSNRLAEMIKFVVDCEGPIHETILAERISDLHGFSDLTDQCLTRVSYLARKYRDSVHELTGEFFWPRGSDPEKDAPARYKGREGKLRKLEFLPLAEIKKIISSPIVDRRDFKLEKVFDLESQNTDSYDERALKRLQEARES